jgi:hypothetical protein
VVAKYDSVGNLQWTGRIGPHTGYSAWATGVWADSDGNAYITGSTEDSLGQPYLGGPADAFLAKYDGAGNLQWTRTLGTNLSDVGSGVSGDALGNVYIVGATQGLLGDPLAPNGNHDAFLAQYDATGNLRWAKRIGAPGDYDLGSGVSTDGLGNAYITGWTRGNTSTSRDDAFLAKYDAAGGLQWTRQFGTSDTDNGKSVSADKLGNVYVAGHTEANLNGPNAGGADGFLVKYDAAGTLQWTKQFGTSANEIALAASTDGLGNVYISGAGPLPNFGPSADTNAFLARYDTSGNLQWSMQIGDPIAADVSNGVAADGLGSVYLSGKTWGSVRGPSSESRDLFLVKVNVPEPSAWALNADGNWSEAGNWTAAVPNAAGARAAFTSVITQPRTVSVNVPVTVARIDFDNANAYTIAGPNSLTFDAVSGDAQINVMAGSHTIAAPVTLADNTLVTVTPAASNLVITRPLSASGITLSKSGAGTLTLNNIRAAGLSINAGRVAIAPPAALPEPSTSVLGALSIAGDTAPAAKLDLTNNAAIIDYAGLSPAATVRQQIVAGRGGAGLGKTWNGNGITSSAAATANAADSESRSLGYAENSQLPLGHYTNFRGQPVDSTSLLIAYTRTGDANLDGVVNDDDVTIVGANYAPGVVKAAWAFGDFDYNGFVDDDDVTLLGAFYNPAATPLIAPAASEINAAAVPEPRTFTLLASATLLLTVLATRRDRSRLPACTAKRFNDSSNDVVKVALGFHIGIPRSALQQRR